MSDRKEVVNNIIHFIETKERELQAAKLANDIQFRTDIVKSILDELERETKDENQ